MPPLPPPLVVDVWADNQDAELARIHGLIRNFDIAAVATSHDVPLPASPRSPPPHTLDSCYEAVRSRVDRVRFAQLGLALFNCDGELGGVWRFHLGDTAAGDERFLAGIGVDPARRRRADPRRVCRALRESSRAIIPRGVWVTSDGADDAAYLVRHICDGGRLPRRRDEFVRVCATSFPALYDLKVLAEWTTVGENAPPLAGAGSGTPLFTRFLALAREFQFTNGMVGYTGFLYGLGAVDNLDLVHFKKLSAELEEKNRRMMAFLSEGCDEEYLQRLVLGW